MKTGQRFFCCWLWVAIAVVQFSAAAESVWDRVVVVGASASSGFMLSEPFGGTNTVQCRLSRYLDAAIVAPHSPVKNLATPLLFMSPEALGTQEMDAATNCRPTLIVGVDFLFWFCYGEGATDAERARRFESGLKILERVAGPLVIGDIPDAASATNSGIISAAQVPSETARRAANARLQEWAAARSQVAPVVVVPLADFMRAVKANEALRLHGQTLPAGTTRALLQADGLHPNPPGAAAMTLGILDALVTQNKTFPATNLCWDLETLRRRVTDMPQFPK